MFLEICIVILMILQTNDVNIYLRFSNAIGRNLCSRMARPSCRTIQFFKFDRNLIWFLIGDSIVAKSTEWKNVAETTEFIYLYFLDMRYRDRRRNSCFNKIHMHFCDSGTTRLLNILWFSPPPPLKLFSVSFSWARNTYTCNIMILVLTNFVHFMI